MALSSHQRGGGVNADCCGGGAEPLGGQVSHLLAGCRSRVIIWIQLVTLQPLQCIARVTHIYECRGTLDWRVELRRKWRQVGDHKCTKLFPQMICPHASCYMRKTVKLKVSLMMEIQQILVIGGGGNAGGSGTVGVQEAEWAYRTTTDKSGR